VYSTLVIPCGNIEYMTGGRRAVYTALFGSYEELNPDPLQGNSTEIPLICFTDSADLTSDVWEIRRIDPVFESDPIRNARLLKVRGHASLAEFDESLWIDNTVTVHQRPEELLDEWLDGADIALPLHSYRESVLAEFDIVARLSLDDPARVYEQLLHYSATSPDALAERPYWTALLARRHTPAVTEAMSRWSDHVLRYSRRDQLSVNYALSRSSVSVKAVEIDNWSSEFHRWPADVRHSRVDPPLPALAMRPPMAELGMLQNQLGELAAQHEQLSTRYLGVVVERDELEGALQEAVRESGEQQARSSAAAGLLSESNAALEVQAAGLRREIEHLKESTSWRATAWLRAITRRRDPGRG